MVLFFLIDNLPFIHFICLFSSESTIMNKRISIDWPFIALYHLSLKTEIFN